VQDKTSRICQSVPLRFVPQTSFAKSCVYSKDHGWMLLGHLLAQAPTFLYRFHQDQISSIMSNYWRQAHDQLQFLNYQTTRHNLIRHHDRSTFPQTNARRSASLTLDPLQNSRLRPFYLCLAWIQSGSFLSSEHLLMAFPSILLSNVERFHRQSTSCNINDRIYHIHWRFCFHSSCTSIDWNLSRIAHLWKHELIRFVIILKLP